MYLVLEGGEATGKSTLAKALYETLLEKGYDVLLTKEPGSLEDSVCGEIRNILLDSDHNVCDKTALLLFCADRAQHITNVVKPALKEKKIVISDRSSLSTVVYHIAKLIVGTSENIPNDYFYEIVDFGQEISPDACFVTNVDWQWAQGQLQARNKLDRIEQFGEDFHKSVHALFQDFASTQLCMLHPLAGRIRIAMQTFPKQIYKLPKTNENSVEQLVCHILSILEERHFKCDESKALAHKVMKNGRAIC